MTDPILNPEYTVAITGASGSIYGKRLLQELLKAGYDVSLVISNPGKLVIAHELGFTFDEDNASAQITDWLADGIDDKARWLDEQSDASREQGHTRESFRDRLAYYRDDDFMAPICSGSHITRGMVIIPCSMATLGAIANGLSSSLIERTADVSLKESRPLIIVPRETPFNRIHIKNLLSVEEAGAKVAPAMPAFYNNPQTIDDMVDFVVGKVLDQMGVEHNLFKRWQGE